MKIFYYYNGKSNTCKYVPELGVGGIVGDIVGQGNDIE